MGEFPFSVTLQGAIDRCRGAVGAGGPPPGPFLRRPSRRDRSLSRRRRSRRATPGHLSLSPFKARCPFLCRPSRRDRSLSRHRRSRRATPGPMVMTLNGHETELERQPRPNYCFQMRTSFYQKNFPLTKTLSHFLSASTLTYQRRMFSF